MEWVLRGMQENCVCPPPPYSIIAMDKWDVSLRLFTYFHRNIGICIKIMIVPQFLFILFYRVPHMEILSIVQDEVASMVDK